MSRQVISPIWTKDDAEKFVASIEAPLLAEIARLRTLLAEAAGFLPAILEDLEREQRIHACADMLGGPVIQKRIACARVWLASTRTEEES